MLNTKARHRKVHVRWPRVYKIRKEAQSVSGHENCGAGCPWGQGLGGGAEGLLRHRGGCFLVYVLAT